MPNNDNTKPLPLSQSLERQSQTSITNRPGTFDNFRQKDNIKQNENNTDFNELLDFINKTPFKDMVQQLILSKVIGKIYSDELESDSDNIEMMELGLMGLNQNVQLVHYVETNQTQIVDIDSTPNVVIAQSMAEWISKIFKRQFKDEFKQTLLDFINARFKQNFELTQSAIEMQFATPYIKDDIFQLLCIMKNINPDKETPNFELKNLGKVEQTLDRTQWLIIVNGKQKIYHPTNGSLDTFIEILADTQTDNPELKNKIIKNVKNKYLSEIQKRTINTPPPIFEPEDDELENDNHFNESGDISDWDYNPPIYAESNKNDEDEDDSVFLKNILGDFDESILDTAPPIDEIPPEIRDQLDMEGAEWFNNTTFESENSNYTSSTIQNYDKMTTQNNYFLELQENEPPISQQIEQVESDNVMEIKQEWISWAEIEQYNNVPVKYFMNYLMAQDEAFSPKRIDENNVAHFSNKNYEIQVKIAGNGKLMFNDEEIKISQWFDVFFNQIGATEKSYAKGKALILNFFKENEHDLKSYLIDEIAYHQILNSEYETIDDFYAADIVALIKQMHLAKIGQVDGANGLPTYIINDKRYRFKDDNWYCMDDKEVKQGISSFLQIAFPDQHNLIIKSLNDYLFNKAVEQLINDESFVPELKLHNTYSQNGINQQKNQVENEAQSAHKIVNNKDESSMADIHQEEIVNLPSFENNDESIVSHLSNTELPINNDNETNNESIVSHLSNTEQHPQVETVENEPIVSHLINDEISENNEIAINNEPIVSQSPQTESVAEKNAKIKATSEINKHHTHSEILSIQAEQRALKDVTQENLQALIEAKKETLLSKRILCDNFSLPTFLEKCIELYGTNNRLYQVQKVDNSGRKFLFGKELQEINLDEPPYNSIKKVSQFVSHMFALKGLPKEGVEKELNRLNNCLSESFDFLVKNLILSELEANQEKMVQKAEVAIRPEQNNTMQNKPVPTANHTKTTTVKQVDLSQMTKEQLWDWHFYKDKISKEQPLKKYLYEYTVPDIPINTPSVNFNRLIHNMVALENYFRASKGQTDITTPRISTKYERGAIQYTISLPNETITAISGMNKESWVSTIGAKGDSLVSCFKEIIAPQLGINFYSTSFHNQLGRCLEETFYKEYPKLELCTHYTNISTKNEIGDMKWGYHNESDTVIFWNGKGEHMHNTFLIAKLIALQELHRGQAKGWEAYSHDKAEWGNHPDNKEVTIKAKELIKEHYMGLNSLQRKELINSRPQTQAENSVENLELFQLLSPRITEEATNEAERYLIENRCLNPAIVEHHKGSLWFGGLYNYNQSLKYRPDSINEEEDFVPVAVFVNPSLTFAAVRGIENFGAGAEVKQNVPGSQDNNDPIMVHSGKLYTTINKDLPEKKSIVFCEAAIDALSYSSLYPDADVFSMSGAKTNLLVRCLQEMNDFINQKEIEKGSIEYVFALDSIELDENNVALDSTSRANYFKLLDTMGQFCFSKNFFDKNVNEIDGYQDDDCVEHALNLLRQSERYSEQQMRRATNTLNEYREKSTDRNPPSYHIPEFQRTIGKLIFEFEYIDKGLFRVATPTHPELGKIKDWNDYLKGLVKIRQEQNPDLPIQEIHNLITQEHSPNLMLKSTKAVKNTLTAKPKI